MSKRKKINFSKVILPLIIIFFSTILILSLPVLFNFNSIQNTLEKKFYTEFKINLKILDDINLKTFPLPHYSIKKANLNLNIKDKNSSKIKVKNLKIFIPINKIYSKSNIKINRIEIEKANFYFKINDILDFRNHLYYKINEPIRIKKSNFFYIDENDKTILISPIHNLNYFINKKSNSKELKINGNIFDIDYKSNWKRYFDSPKNTINEINLKNPNLIIKNSFNLENRHNFNGKSSISFLNEIININYIFKNNQINIETPDLSKKQKIKINSKIELDPFFFDMKLDIGKKNINFLTDYLLNILLNSKEEYLENINGNLSIIVNNLKNPIIKSGKINLSIKEKVIKIENSLFDIEDIGKIKSDFRYYENKGDLIFTSKNILEIINKKEFSRRFQIRLKKLNKLNKIYFDLEKNIDNGEISISNIHLNKIDEANISDDYYIIENIQLLKALIRNVLS